MPLYDFRCGDELMEDVYIPLSEWTDTIVIWDPKVGHKFFLLELSKAAVHDWGDCQQGRYFEHVSATGEFFRDKKQFKEYLKRNGLAEHATYG